MKLCMIGCGDFARRFHGPAQRRCAVGDGGLELAGCCDVDPRQAGAYAESFGYARTYAETDVMLTAERPDAVVLAVPPAITCQVASQVLTRGFPLLLEKPPGLNLGELIRLTEAAEKGRALAQVGFNRRHMPVMQRAREILRTEFAASPVTRIDYEMLRYERWDDDFSTTAVHAIDALRFLADSPFAKVQIAYQILTRGALAAVGVSAEVECVSGTRARLEIQPVAGRNAESAKLHALGQTLAITIPYPGKTMGAGTVEHWRADERVASFTDAGLDDVEKLGVVGETKAFLAAVRSGSCGSPGLRDCREQVRLMEAIRRRLPGLNELPE